MSKTISDQSKILIQYLFEDDDVKRCLARSVDGENYKKVTVNPDGSITFGRTKVSWWNHLTADEKTVGLGEWALKVVGVLSGKKANCQEIILKGLGQEVITNLIKNEDYDAVIDRLFDAARYGVQGPLHTKGFNISDDIRGHIKIMANGKDRKVAVLPGSGDVIAEVKLGITDVDWKV